MSKIYEAWAIELIDKLHQEWTDPFSPENYKAAIEKLAKNLEEDISDKLEAVRNTIDHEAMTNGDISPYEIIRNIEKILEADD